MSLNHAVMALRNVAKRAPRPARRPRRGMRPVAGSAAPAGAREAEEEAALPAMQSLVNRGEGLKAWEFANLYGFELERFQQEAVDCLLQGNSVVVSAPTGSGKTLVGEAAAISALAKGQRVVYTTPLKALSNQKFRQFREAFGTDNVGLRTGDTAINGSASLVVMTTEILRNMLYSSAGSHSAPPGLDSVCACVLDEVHYLGDPNRGTVWEECIVYAPPSIQLMCLSATIGNPSDLTQWISSVHGPCKLIQSDFRPVPLTWHLSQPAIGQDGGMVPLLDKRGSKMSPKLRKQRKRARDNESWDMSDAEAAATTPVSLHETLDQLRSNDMLPAIWFIFSRKRCDTAVQKLMQSGACLTSPSEREAISSEVASLSRTDPESVRTSALAALKSGMAAHHAGLLPAWKGIIERLFQRGLVKVVFSTETLAAGINMPARSAVLASVTKRRNEGISLLTTNELMQMAGRAGRRGFDTMGNVVIQQQSFDSAKEACSVALGDPEPLKSQYRVTYGMILNLVWNKELSECKALLARSFGNFLTEEAQRTVEEARQLDQRAANSVREAWVSAGYEPEKVDRLLSLQEETERQKARLNNESERTPWIKRSELSAKDRKSLAERERRFEAAKRRAKEFARESSMDSKPTEVKRARRRATKLREQAKALREGVRGNSEGMWASFQRGIGVLTAMGALESPSLQLTSLGKLAAEAKADNELFLAICLSSRSLCRLTPGEFAAITCCLVTGESAGRLGTRTSPQLEPSENVRNALNELEPSIQVLEECQEDHGFGTPPIIDDRLASCIEAWAWGCSWSEVSSMVSSMDEGDLVRSFRRTVDLLKQLPKLPHVPQPSKRLADKALKLVDRPPVQEVLE